MPTAATFAPPSSQRYVDAFRAIGSLTDTQLQILRVHYLAPARTITAKHLASAMGYRNYSVANLQYGRLARLVGEKLDYNPEPERLGTLVSFDERQGEWHWLMRPEVAQALESLGWVADSCGFFPEEMTPTTPLAEGAVCQISVNAYERNSAARKRCIEHHGRTCCICGFSFGAVYGKVAELYIQVHHLRPLSDIRGEYIVDPIEDLRPVCPNCHAVLHMGENRLFSIEEVRSFLAANR